MPADPDHAGARPGLGPGREPGRRAEDTLQQSLSASRRTPDSKYDLSSLNRETTWHGRTPSTGTGGWTHRFSRRLPRQLASPALLRQLRSRTTQGMLFFFFLFPFHVHLFSKTHKINFTISKEQSFLKSDVEGEVSGHSWVTARLAGS